jgi:hypothetical protein
MSAVRLVDDHGDTETQRRLVRFVHVATRRQSGGPTQKRKARYSLFGFVSGSLDA